MLLDRLSSPAPKKILSLDGGGMRGALTLGFLEKIEAVLRERLNNPRLKLCDYFDLIGGTSTGSIIASALAIGMEVAEIKEKYFELGKFIFGSKNDWYIPWETWKRLKKKYEEGPLEDELKKLFGDITLGDMERIKTGLCIVAKRADTNSIWPLINHPNGTYYKYNKDLYLHTVIRASAAAPTYFVPVYVEVNYDKKEKAAFVDGGVSMANNPALQLFKVATLKGFPFRWNTGENNMLLVSVGTGMVEFNKLPEKMTKNTFAAWGLQVPEMLMQDASWQNQIILQWISKCPNKWHIDGEIGNLCDDMLCSKPLLTYMRYNVTLEKELGENNLTHCGFGDCDEKEIEQLQKMDSYERVEKLYEIGKAGAERQVNSEHFENFN